MMILGLGAFLLFGALFLAGRKIISMRQVISKKVVKAKKGVRDIKKLRRAILAMPKTPKPPTKEELEDQTTRLAKKHTLTFGYIRGRETTHNKTTSKVQVNINFNNIALPNLLQFLHDVEYNKIIKARVGEVSFRKPLPGKERYEATVTLYALKPKPPGRKKGRKK